MLVFGALFVVLFLAIAVVDGVGDPSIPSGDIIFVQGVPDGGGDVTKADFEHALAQAAAQGRQKTTPKPGDKNYEELKEAALKSLGEPIWLEGLGREEGIVVSDKEVEAEFKKLKKENFKTEAEYKKFLKEASFTQEDVNQRVKLQKLTTELQEKLKADAPQPSQSEVENYYEAAKSTQFTQKPSRDIRVVVNKDRKKAEEALKALSTDDTAKNWEKVAAKYSEDTATKETGGLKKSVTEESVEEPLTEAFFDTPEGQVEGPVSAEGKYTVFEVQNTIPESVQSLKTVEAQIKTTLAQRLEQESFNTFVANFNVKYQERTFCADGYTYPSCANFKGNGHPPTAPEACYEANPKGGLPEACPAPVSQLLPALPGTVTPLEPKGKPLAQRPHPAGEGKEGAATIPGGEVSPTGAPPTEAPPEEAPPEEAPPEESK